MSPTEPSTTTSPRRGPLPRFRVWHLALLVAFVAIAIANIQDQRRNEPALIALAAGGFVLYALLAWAGWRLADRYRPRIGEVATLALYLTALAALFVVATIIYLMIEHAYLFGV